LSWRLLIDVTRVLLGSSVCKVEALSSHLRTNAPILNLKNQPSERGICQVKVPHVFERAFVDLTNSCCVSTTHGTTERISTQRSAWHLINYAKCILEEVLLGFVL
jgi:hypothetical protein